MSLSCRPESDIPYALPYGMSMGVVQAPGGPYGASNFVDGAQAHYGLAAAAPQLVMPYPMPGHFPKHRRQEYDQDLHAGPTSTPCSTQQAAAHLADGLSNGFHIGPSHYDVRRRSAVPEFAVPGPPPSTFMAPGLPHLCFAPPLHPHTQPHNPARGPGVRQQQQQQEQQKLHRQQQQQQQRAPAPRGPAGGRSDQQVAAPPERKQQQRKKRVQKGLEGNVKRTVYISYIDQQVTEEMLANFFQDCGTVMDCRICGDPNSAMRFAFIEFMEADAMPKAVALTGRTLGKSPLRVQPSKTAIVPVNKELMPRSHHELERCSRTVYVANIDKKVEREDVCNFFEHLCGGVAKIRLLGDFVHSTCIAFIEFTTAEGAMAALNCSGAMLGSLPLRISPSKTPVRGDKEEDRPVRRAGSAQSTSPVPVTPASSATGSEVTTDSSMGTPSSNVAPAEQGAASNCYSSNPTGAAAAAASALATVATSAAEAASNPVQLGLQAEQLPGAPTASAALSPAPPACRPAAVLLAADSTAVTIKAEQPRADTTAGSPPAAQPGAATVPAPSSTPPPGVATEFAGPLLTHTDTEGVVQAFA